MWLEGANPASSLPVVKSSISATLSVVCSIFLCLVMSFYLSGVRDCCVSGCIDVHFPSHSLSFCVLCVVWFASLCLGGAVVSPIHISIGSFCFLLPCKNDTSGSSCPIIELFYIYFCVCSLG